MGPTVPKEAVPSRFSKHYTSSQLLAVQTHINTTYELFARSIYALYNMRNSVQNARRTAREERGTIGPVLCEILRSKCQDLLTRLEPLFTEAMAKLKEFEPHFVNNAVWSAKYSSWRSRLSMSESERMQFKELCEGALECSKLRPEDCVPEVVRRVLRFVEEGKRVRDEIREEIIGRVSKAGG